MSEPHIQVYEGAEGWRWTYRDPDAGVALHGNQDFGSAAEASAAASLAYPGIPVGSGEPAEVEPEDDGRGRLLLKLLGGLLAAAGLIVLLRWLASLDDD